MKIEKKENSKLISATMSFGVSGLGIKLSLTDIQKIHNSVLNCEKKEENEFLWRFDSVLQKAYKHFVEDASILNWEPCAE